MTKYGNLNNLAEGIFNNGRVCTRTLRELCFITHFQQDIAYYLDMLLPYIRSEQIYSIFTQETLDSDIESILGIKSTRRQNSNKDAYLKNKFVLSDRARDNLKEVFKRDYECIRTLAEIHPIDKKTIRDLLA